MFAATVQEGGPAVSPAAVTYGAEKVATVSSKTKSPWKPMRLWPPVVVEFIKVVFTGSMITVETGTEVSKLAVGKETVINGTPSATGGRGSGG
jgi:uncharacterized pyridoxamine 5'-phosphate oxidase family protein